MKMLVLLLGWLSNIEMQIELVQCKIKQIYKYADKFMKERRSNQCHI